MKINTILLNIALLSVPFLCFAQHKAGSPPQIEVVPGWVKNEVHQVVIRCTTTDIVNEKPISCLTTFNAAFKVLEKNQTGYLVEWVYTNSVIADKDPNLENTILAKLLNVKFTIKLSGYGSFIELANADELRAAANNAIDALNAKEANAGMKAQYNGVKQMIASKQGLEISLLKYIKLYTISFGYEYKLGFEQLNDVKFPNPFGGEAFDAVEKVKLISIDNKNAVCKIESSKVVEGSVLTKSVMEFLKRNNKDKSKEIEQQFGNKVFEITENLMQEINFKTGILLKSSFKRKMNLGIQNRTVLIEIEPIE